MAILKEIILGTKIINEIESSNLVKTEYDTITKNLVVEFKNGIRYEFDEGPHQLYTSFRSAKSHGNFFNKEISKTFKYKKLT